MEKQSTSKESLESKAHKILDETILAEKEKLIESGYFERGDYMCRILYQQEIRFRHVRDNLYIFDNVYYSGKLEKK